MKRIKIANKNIGENEPCFIIAEAGVNHNGSFKLAKKMIDEAKKFGADAIKFQTYITEELVTNDAPKAEYQNRSVKDSQFDMLKKLELSQVEFIRLKKYAKSKKINFLSTPFDIPSAVFLNKIKVSAFKIGSGELNNFPLLEKIASFKKPIILSTGMSDLSEVKAAVEKIKKKNSNLILLHCTTDYPAKIDEVNLKAMDTLKSEFNLPVGFSDHTPGITVSLAARSLGACVIEKHFTLDKKMPGPDHLASLDKNEFSDLVAGIRTIEKALGDGKKVPQKSEVAIKKIARKSVASRVYIEKGQKITEEMLKICRPGTGIAPGFIGKIIGKSAKIDILANKLIDWKELK